MRSEKVGSQNIKCSHTWADGRLVNVCKQHECTDGSWLHGCTVNDNGMDRIAGQLLGPIVGAQKATIESRSS